MGSDAAFVGAKLALFLGDRLVVLLRDDRPDLPFPGHWDLPGGGREDAETPLECALRECHEELGLRVRETAIVWCRAFGDKWFFVGRMAAQAANDIVFGDEGQRWDLMTPADFMAHPKAVPALQDRLRVYLETLGNAELTRKDPPLP